MEPRNELDKLDINQLYEWVNQQYDNFASGKISEAEYQADLDFYKSKLAQSNNDPTPVASSSNTPSSMDPEKGKTSTRRVRSTSIAGLRKKLLDELND